MEAGSGRLLLACVERTSTWLERLRGLLARPEPDPDGGLLITPCRSIHMIGMLYPLDVVFLDCRGRVVSCKRRLLPMGFAVDRRAVEVLELRSGSIDRLGIREQMRLVWEEKIG